jgi:hypothetical protein
MNHLFDLIEQMKHLKSIAPELGCVRGHFVVDFRCYYDRILDLETEIADECLRLDFEEQAKEQYCSSCDVEEEKSGLEDELIELKNRLQDVKEHIEDGETEEAIDILDELI